MPITLASIAGVSERGQRSNNEDYVHPLPEVVTTQQQRFIVCDGVGGSRSGEVASQLTATAIDDFLKNLGTVTYSEDDLQLAVMNAQQRLTDHIKKQPQAQDLATTLTIVQIQPNDILLGHIGDSRIYQFRAGKIIFRTRDHSLVNEMVAEGLIKQNQIATHPQRNVITRAVHALEEGEVKLETQRLTDVQKDDYFLLCTDGILEGFTDLALQDLFMNTTQKASTIIELLKKQCQQSARDNFSAYVLKIGHSTIDTMAKEQITVAVFGRSVRPFSILPLIVLVLVILWLVGQFFLQ